MIKLLRIISLLIGMIPGNWKKTKAVLAILYFIALIIFIVSLFIG